MKLITISIFFLIILSSFTFALLGENSKIIINNFVPGVTRPQANNLYCWANGTNCVPSNATINVTVSGITPHTLNGSNHTGALSSGRVVKDTGTYYQDILLDIIIDLLFLRIDAVNSTPNIEGLGFSTGSHTKLIGNCSGSEDCSEILYKDTDISVGSINVSGFINASGGLKVIGNASADIFKFDDDTLIYRNKTGNIIFRNPTANYDTWLNMDLGEDWQYGVTFSVGGYSNIMRFGGTFQMEESKELRFGNQGNFILRSDGFPISVLTLRGKKWDANILTVTIDTGATTMQRNANFSFNNGQFLFTQNGSMGIGVINPIEKLEVNGTILANGNLTSDKIKATDCTTSDVSMGTDGTCIDLNATITELVKSLTYYATNITTEVGTVTGGNTTSIKVRHDDNWYNVTVEGGSPPSLIVIVNFTNIPSFDSIHMDIFYESQVGREITIGIYECNNGDYEENYPPNIVETNSVLSHTARDVTDPGNHICGDDNTVSIRFNYLGTGVGTDTFSLDSLFLVQGAPISSITEEDPFSIHKEGDVPWQGNEQGNGFNTTGWNIGSFASVGIGTATPTSELHVVGDITSDKFITGTTSLDQNLLSFSAQAQIKNIANSLELIGATMVLAASTIVSQGVIVPSGDNTLDLGTSNKHWRDLFLGRNAKIGGTLNVTGDLDVGGDILTGTINSSSWLNVSITESQINDLVHIGNCSVSESCNSIVYNDTSDNYVFNEIKMGNLNVTGDNLGRRIIGIGSGGDPAHTFIMATDSSGGIKNTIDITREVNDVTNAAVGDGVRIRGRLKDQSRTANVAAIEFVSEDGGAARNGKIVFRTAISNSLQIAMTIDSGKDIFISGDLDVGGKVTATDFDPKTIQYVHIIRQEVIDKYENWACDGVYQTIEFYNIVTGYKEYYYPLIGEFRDSASANYNILEKLSSPIYNTNCDIWYKWSKVYGTILEYFKSNNDYKIELPNDKILDKTTGELKDISIEED